MRESRVALRAEFVKNKTVVPEGPHFEGLLTMIDEAEDMLLHGIVRGELNESSGNYEVKLKDSHADAGGEGSITNVEPITAETGAEASAPPKVEVTRCSKDDHR